MLLSFQLSSIWLLSLKSLLNREPLLSSQDRNRTCKITLQSCTRLPITSPDYVACLSKLSPYKVLHQWTPNYQFWLIRVSTLLHYMGLWIRTTLAVRTGIEPATMQPPKDVMPFSHYALPDFCFNHR